MSGFQRNCDEADLARLAALSTLEYARVRKTEAENFNIPVAWLDKAVDDKRKKAAAQTPTNNRWQIEPWDEQVNGAALLNDLSTVFERYVVLPEHGAVAMALWTLQAWTIDAAFASPFLMFSSPEMRCGKSTALKLLNRIAPRAVMASNISPSAIFRYVEAHKPTLLIDEGDTFVVSSEEMRGILNSGHTRDTANVIRLVGDNHEPKEFSTWGPKAIASIGKLAATLRDRAIIITMHRKGPGEHVTKLRTRDDDGEFVILRRKAARWAADNVEALKIARPDISESLNDRAADNWEPLLAIADLAGPHWQAQARKAAKAISEAAEADTPTIRLQLLAAIQRLFAETKMDRLPSRTILAELHRDEEGPWIAYGKSGKPITARQVGNLLSNFKIHPRTIGSGADSSKGYLLAWFTDAFTRYLPYTPHTSVAPSQPNNIKRLGKNSSFAPDFFATDKNLANPLKNKGCDGATDTDPPSKHNGGTGHRCRQCDAEPDGTEQSHTTGDETVWLHLECRPFWVEGDGWGRRR